MDLKPFSKVESQLAILGVNKDPGQAVGETAAYIVGGKVDATLGEKLLPKALQSLTVSEGTNKAANSLGGSIRMHSDK